MSREGQRTALHLAQQRVRELLAAHSRGEATWQDIEDAQADERALERKGRVSGARTVKGMPGMLRFQCSSCGNETIAHEDVCPAPFPNGFRIAGKCGTCRGESDI